MLELECGCPEAVVIEADTLIDAMKKARGQYAVRYINRGRPHKELIKCPIHNRDNWKEE